MMKMTVKMVFIFFVLGLIFILPGGRAAHAAKNPEHNSSAVLANLHYRFLWPEDESKPGEKLIELKTKSLGSSSGRQTPLGPASAETLELSTPSGELVAQAKILTLPDHPEVKIFQTEIKKRIAAPTGKFEKPHFALPAIGIPEGYTNVLNFAVEEFVTPMRYAVPTSGPVLMYSHDLDVLVLSPLDNFMAALQAPVKHEWRCGFGGMIEDIPEGTVAQTMLVAGHGINAAFLKWGELIQKWHGHQPVDPYADIAMSRLGYWTDNGAYYYYRAEPDMNYAQTLLKVKEYAEREGIPYGYFQLDSWFYPKGEIKDKSSSGRGGFLLWEPIPEMFPDGLPAFQKSLGLPLVAHNRYCADQSPYCARYNCVFSAGDKKQGAYPTDPRFWDEIMDNAVSYGVKVYEQDWLYTQMNMIPWLRSGLHNAEGWYDNMAHAAAKRGLTMQLCMASPEFFMQQLKHNNATHARTSHDYKGGLPKAFFWMPFHKASLFAYAVGLWPFKDNFASTAGQSAKFKCLREANPWEEALISSLSGGPVGPSDRIGKSDRDLILHTCRQDGLLLKPDRPATPIDVMFLYDKNIFIGGRKPWVVTTESNHNIGRTTYLMAVNLWPLAMREPFVTLAQAGISGKHLIYNYRTGQAKVVDGKISFGLMPADKGFYYVLCPILKNGMALIGETGKFITLSKKRFPEVKLVGDTLQIEIEGIPTETVALSVYSSRSPEIVSGKDIAKQEKQSPEIYNFTIQIPESGKTSMIIK